MSWIYPWPPGCFVRSLQLINSLDGGHVSGGMIVHDTGIGTGADRGALNGKGTGNCPGVGGALGEQRPLKLSGAGNGTTH